MLEMTRENHRMIKRLYKAYWWSKIGSLIYWLVIIGVVFGVFYYIQPYLGLIGDILVDLQEKVNSVRDVF